MIAERKRNNDWSRHVHENYYLGDPDEVKRATETAARQGKA
jgi:hypothetical protein